MFNLMTHSTHFFTVIRHYTYIVKGHSDSEKGTPLLPYGLLFPNNSKGSFYASSHRQDNTHHSLCYTSREVLAGTEIAQWVHHEGSIRQPIILLV